MAKTYGNGTTRTKRTKPVAAKPAVAKKSMGKARGKGKK